MFLIQDLMGVHGPGSLRGAGTNYHHSGPVEPQVPHTGCGMGDSRSQRGQAGLDFSCQGPARGCCICGTGFVAHQHEFDALAPEGVQDPDILPARQTEHRTHTEIMQ